MFTWIWIFEIVLVGQARRGALAWSPPALTCEEFERGALFDPYQTIDSMWKIFYFWGNTSETNPIIFTLPVKQILDRFRLVVETADPQLAAQIPWRHSTLLMEPRPGVMILMLYQGTPGAFRAIIKMERRDQIRPHPMPVIRLADIRVKMVDRYIGFMACEEMTMYALSRMYEMPETEEECEKAAAKLGFPLGGGRSHIYLTNLREEDDEDEQDTNDEL